MATQTILDDAIGLFWRAACELPWSEISDCFHGRLHRLLKFCIAQTLQVETVSSTQWVEVSMKSSHPYFRAPTDPITLEDLLKLLSAFSDHPKTLLITTFLE